MVSLFHRATIINNGANTSSFLRTIGLSANRAQDRTPVVHSMENYFTLFFLGRIADRYRHRDTCPSVGGWVCHSRREP